MGHDNHPCLETGPDGFLLDASTWNESVAERLASLASLVLTEKHWEIIRFIRDHHARYRHLPSNRMFVKLVERHLGPERGNSRYLNALFRGNPVRYACLLAGLPKPPGCL